MPDEIIEDEAPVTTIAKVYFRKVDGNCYWLNDQGNIVGAAADDEGSFDPNTVQSFDILVPSDIQRNIIQNEVLKAFGIAKPPPRPGKTKQECFHDEPSALSFGQTCGWPNAFVIKTTNGLEWLYYVENTSPRINDGETLVATFKNGVKI